MFKKKKHVNHIPLVGQRAELVHDATVFQYGTIFLNGERYSVKTNDGSELCKGRTVEVLAENDSHLIVRAV
jgi:membrane-bound ClpP family serine protease